MPKKMGWFSAHTRGKHTDELAIELVARSEGKTNCKEWHTDGWEGYERVLPDEVEHYISKDRLWTWNDIATYPKLVFGTTQKKTIILT